MTENKVEKKVNEVKAEVKVVNLYGYDFKLSEEVLKKTSELTSEDIDALPKVPLCTLESVKNRSGSRRYIMKAHLVPNKIVVTSASPFSSLCLSTVELNPPIVSSSKPHIEPLLSKTNTISVVFFIFLLLKK